MKTLIASRRDVDVLLPMAECMDVMTAVLRTLARGDALLPLRSIMRLPDGSGLLGLMPAYVGEPPSLGVKAVSVFPGNHGSPYDSHQGAVLLFEVEHGRLLAIVDATSVTAIRTAAVSGVATKLLAREDADELAILGSGTQARTHLEAMLLARPIRRVRVWSRTPGRAQAFADRESRRHGIEIEPAPSARTAVEGAGIVCTTTSSPHPILLGDWLAPGTHLNAVGSSAATSRELDPAAVARSRLFVDRRESTLNESGDFLMAKREGAVTDDHILGELGELLLGRVAGRRSADEITLFKSLGIAVEDVAAARHIYDRASREGGGTWIELGGAREAQP